MHVTTAGAFGLDTSGDRIQIPRTTANGAAVAEVIAGRIELCIPAYDPGHWFDWPCHFIVDPPPGPFVLGMAGVTADLKITIDPHTTAAVAPCGMLIIE